MNDFLHGDCIDLMMDVKNKSIDMILCDLPYGTTQNKWDVIIPFERLWLAYNRIIKDNGAIVLMSQQPFTTYLILSQINLFRYEIIWEKDRATGHLNSKKMPLKAHENILLFYKKAPVYNPQMRNGLNISNKSSVKKSKSKSGNYGDFNNYQRGGNLIRFPRSILKFNTVNSANGVIHPTQKPVALFEWLVNTYTDQRQTVLDNCAGSGTTAIACINTNRNYICMEKDVDYFNIASDRIANHNSSILTKSA